MSPNSIHLAIAKFDHHFDTVVVAQNIDDLHERSGSKKVIHAHGCVLRREGEIPDVVLFGEPIKHREEIEGRITNCDILIYVGTSGRVFPINAYPDVCETTKIEINIGKTSISDSFDMHMHHGNSAVSLEKLLKFMTRLS